MVMKRLHMHQTPTSGLFALTLLLRFFATVSSFSIFHEKPVKPFHLIHQIRGNNCVSNKRQGGFGVSRSTLSKIDKATILSDSTTYHKGTVERNIFHNYDKPLVLVGCSSASGNELTRLAQSLETRISRNSRNTSSSKDVGNDRIANEKIKIIQLGANRDDELVESLETERLGWDTILVVDLGDALTTTVGDESSEIYYANLIKQLYHDNGLLCFYINVDSSMFEQPTTTERKNRMEEATFVPYTDYEICIKYEGTSTFPDDWEHIEWEFCRLIARARLIPAVPGDTTRSANTAHLSMGLHTFFLSLSFPNIQQVEPYVEQMCQDVDAMEYRTDLLDCRASRFDLLYGMQLLRKYCRPYTVRVPALPLGPTVLEDVMPIVYTVRTANQAGKYPDDDEGIRNMFRLLQWGLRGGVEVLDVESAWDYSQTCALLDRAEERYSTQILGSHHVVGKEIEMEDAVGLYEQCAMNGRAHGAKVVLSIKSDAKDRLAYEAGLIANELAKMDELPVIPSIGLILGDVGQFSRVINFHFTPVTHESLPFAAAPGQLTANEIMTTRMLTGLFRPKKYCILGHNIAYSVSPQMHGAAFAATRLPHEYIRIDVATIEEFVNSPLFTSSDFGGGSVTIPHKQAVIPYVDVLDEAAAAIGSVNTIRIDEEFNDDTETFERIVRGYNTDWRGIYNPLYRILSTTAPINPDTDYALIVGAGGTARAAAYVIQKLGLKCLYYNRTPGKAVTLAERFGGTVIESLEQEISPIGDNGYDSDEDKNILSLGDILGDENSLRVVISTVPASSKFVLPEWIVQGISNVDMVAAIRPVIFDVCYKPYSTALLQQAENAGLIVVRGSEMLWEQGVGQFEIWTGRTAPYRIMKEVVLKNCEE